VKGPLIRAIFRQMKTHREDDLTSEGSNPSYKSQPFKGSLHVRSRFCNAFLDCVFTV